MKGGGSPEGADRARGTILAQCSNATGEAKGGPSEALIFTDSRGGKYRVFCLQLFTAVAAPQVVSGQSIGRQDTQQGVEAGRLNILDATRVGRASGRESSRRVQSDPIAQGRYIGTHGQPPIGLPRTGRTRSL
jgi:hypothetical protein